MNERDARLSNADFNRLRALIYRESGISLNSDKKTMLEMRINPRLLDLGISSYAEYCDYVFTLQGRAEELVNLIDAATTNKTSFFREANHFNFLVAKALPEITARRSFRRNTLIWSAGCSTGEEAYTLAMVLSQYERNRPDFQFSVLATDICTAVLDKARRGIFDSQLVDPVPKDLRLRYFMRSRDRTSDSLRAVPELRARIEFRHLNLMDADYSLIEPPSVIFCRNVIIYFDRATQFRILEKLCRLLAPGGYFFAGHSESFQGMDLPLVRAGAAVYRKAELADARDEAV